MLLWFMPETWLALQKEKLNFNIRFSFLKD